MTEIHTYHGMYSPELCRRYPHFTFVFGDNAKRVGNGGQAIIRFEPNVVGVATKRSPGNGPDDFFEDGNSDDLRVLAVDLRRLDVLREGGKQLVLPTFKYGASTLGCGLAELPMRAPTLYALINAWQRKALS